MLEKIRIIKQRFDEVNDLIIQPDIITDQKRYAKLMKEYKDLKLIVDKGEVYKEYFDNVTESEEIIADGSDPEMVEMAKMQMDEAKEGIPKLEDDIRFLLIPKDPEDSKNAVVELRAGTGGDEASIFAGDLFRMYTKYCEGRGWKVDVVDYSEGTNGGFKEIQFEVTGQDVYGTLKFEAGVHRVQRVPDTETQGRIHTSAATVAVLPEAGEVDVKINDDDLEIETVLLDDWRPRPTSLVIEATGSRDGLTCAVATCAPRGTIVLKSTVADSGAFDFASRVTASRRER